VARNPTRKQLAALQDAQELVYDAWEFESPKAQLSLASRAIEISPLCADAWAIRATNAPAGTDERLELLQRALDAGKMALGTSFDELTGSFWGHLETRPYMRAREGLAHELWSRGRRDEAIGHLQDMLRLNPDDNQGVRYALVAWLAETDRHAEIAALRNTYEDGSAMFAWPLALAAFRQGGDCTESRRSLAAALRSNKHVAPLLLGRKKLPVRLPDYYGIGGTDEAVLYVAEMGSGWSETPGALEWLAAQLPPARGPRTASSDRRRSSR
jgi:tetratricopeptide (TPR) repeat protein